MAVVGWDCEATLQVLQEVTGCKAETFGGWVHEVPLGYLLCLKTEMRSGGKVVTECGECSREASV